MSDVTVTSLPLSGTAGRNLLWIGVGALYAAAAVPLFFIYNILPASLRQAGQPPELANLVFLAYLPFALRVIWAPVIDRIGRARADRFRRVALAMIVLAVPLTAALLLLSPADGPFRLIVAATAMIIAVASAMIALDGYLLATLTPDERKRSAGYQGTGFALGGLAMGLGVMALDGAGWQILILLLMAVTTAFALPVLLLPRSTAIAARQDNIGIWRGAARLLRGGPARWRIGFAFTTHTGLALAGGMLPVLQVDAGLSLAEIAALAAVGANAIGLLSAALTGVVLREARPWTVALVVSLLSAAGFVALAWLPGPIGPVFAAIASLTIMALGYAFFVAFRALVLPICQGAGGATQAAALASIDAFVTTVAAIAAGWVLSSFGLSHLLLIAAGLCLAGAILSLLARNGAGEPEINQS